MRMNVVVLAAATLLGVASLTGSAAADYVLCHSSTPGNNGGDLYFGCVVGQRGLTVATVKEYAFEESDHQYWYTRYHTSARKDYLASYCGKDGGWGKCFARVRWRQPGKSSTDTWEAFGSELEGGCKGSTCGFEVKVLAVQCECYTPE